MKKNNLTQQILTLVRKEGVLRPRDLDPLGIPREYLRRLYDSGKLRRAGRGLYILADAEGTEHQTLTEACKRVPHGVVCLLSALRYHDLTTQAPFEVWMAIEEKARHPKVDHPVIRFVRFSGPAFTEGVVEYRIGGAPIKVYNPAKTVADCFKYRNKIGLDVALEALRDCYRSRKCTVDELLKYGEICRVANVMKPYLEAII